MSAQDHLGPQFKQLPLLMTPKEVGGLRSADWDMRPVHEVPERLRGAYDHQDRKNAARGITNEKNPVDHLHDAVEAAGGIERPAKVMHLPTGYTALYDGHHRATVALESNRLLPVKHYTDHTEAREDILWNR